jgi:hypothetical protein
MKTTILAASGLALALLSFPVLAQSTTEKAKATGNDVKRAVKKGANRTKEALCVGTKAECAAQKARDRGHETRDEVVDGAKATKDKVDSDGH